MALVLYGYGVSSCTFRVRIVLNILGKDCEKVSNKDLGSEKYKALNPQQLAPALGVGKHILIQSIPILEYLVEEYPGNTLLPKDKFGKARVRAIAQLVVSEIQPLQNTRLNRYFDKEGIDGPAWGAYWVNEGLRLLEAGLQSPETGKFCHGDTVTLADACMIPQVYSAVNRFKINMDPYPKVYEIYKRCLELDAFEKALPENN